jgi:hypothetical protein
MGNGLHVFKSAVGMFEPLALQDQYVCLHYMAAKYYRKVDFLEALPPFQGGDVGALAANTTSPRTNLTNLDMPDDEFCLLRWYPIDAIQVRMFLPAGIAKFQLKNIQIPIDYKIFDKDPNLVSTEFAIWEDNRPAVEVTNMTAYALGATRMIFMGYRFHTTEVTDKLLLDNLKIRKEPVTDVWCTGRSV